MPSKKKDLNKEEKVQTAAMRSPLLYTVAIIVFVVIIISFVFGSSLSSFTAAAADSPVFGTYMGEDIKLEAGTYFANAYQAQMENAENQAAQTGAQLSLTDVYGAARNAFDSAILRIALTKLGEEAGIVISEKEVTDALIAQHSDAEGNFSQESLEYAMSYTANLKETTATDLLVSAVQSDMFATTSLSESEVDFIASMDDDKRIFDIASFNFSDYPRNEVITSLDENAELFQSVELSSITLDTLKDAEQVLEKLNNRESTFEELATEFSSDIYAADGGSRGLAWYYQMQGDFEEEAATDLLFEISEGEISPIFQLKGDKYAIFRGDSAVIQADATDEDSVSQVKDYVLRLEKGRVADYFKIQAEIFAQRVSEIGWASALTEAGIVATTTSAVGINYGDVYIWPSLEDASEGVLSDSSTRTAFMTEIFSLEQGQSSSATELRDSVVVLRYVEAAEETEGQDDFLKLYYIPYLAQQLQSEEMQRLFTGPELLEDRFDASFTRVFLGAN